MEEEWKEKLDKWLQVSNAFIDLNEMIQKRMVFTVSMIYKYQRLVDVFFSNWIDLTGKEGCTNYIHSIGCCYMQEFLHWYGHLYKMFYQGWEYHNKHMNSIYHTHSQKGRRGPTEEEKARSYLFSVMRSDAGCGIQVKAKYIF